VSILIDGNTRVCVQGITGVGGREHTRSMLEYGTQVVAGVSPGHGGETVHGVPVFDSCAQAARVTGATFGVSFVGSRGAGDAVVEAAQAGFENVICMEEFIPTIDSALARQACALTGTILIGPNCNGIVSPGKAKVGFFPMELGYPGPVGIASRSGTMTYGAMLALGERGLGQSTVVGIGGNSIRGLDFVQCLELFRDDDQTEVVVLLGEVGGLAEQDAAALVARGYPKPVVALISGRHAPAGVAMGHAGAMLEGEQSSWEAKAAALRAAGASVADDLEHLALLAKDGLTVAAKA
jgi:succinyl-CoA synthetase alpha subunit